MTNATNNPWLNIIGIGEDGVQGLSSSARTVLENAEIIIGGDRHHALSASITAQRIKWPHPFDALIEQIKSLRDKRLVILATGDPLWFSVGARIATAIPKSEICFHPQLSAFQWASARMGWSLADVETLTAHGRPAEQIIPYLWHNARLLILTAGSETPGQIARLLDQRGFGASVLTVFGSLGGEVESRFEATASEWAGADPTSNLPAFNTLAVQCLGGPIPALSRLPGLPDEAFLHDGMLTKRAVRAVTLSRLMPARGEVLWDIGTGCASVAIEWMRAAPDSGAVGFDSHQDRLEMARENSVTLGVPRLTLIEGRVPESFDAIPEPTGTQIDLRNPHAVFIGGGLTRELAQFCIQRLPERGRIVANAVTLESEMVLNSLNAECGGELTRIAVEHASPVGRLRGWRPAMTVTQWVFEK